MPTRETVGDRWEEVFQDCEDLIDDKDSGMRDNEKRFLEDTRDRLASYRENTFLTVRQLNWISDLKMKYAKPWED